MGCNCGGGGSALANYEVLNASGQVIKRFSAVKQIEVTTFAAKTPGTTWRKTS